MIEGRGLRALLDETSRLAGCAVEPARPRGADRRAQPDRLGERRCRRRLQVRGEAGVHGTLRLLGAATTHRQRVADAAGAAVALELGRGTGGGHRPGPAQSLVADLAAGVVVSRADVLHRLVDLGWPPLEGRHLVVAAIEVDAAVPVTDAVAATERVLGHEGGVLVGTAAGHVVLVQRGGRRAVPTQVREDLAAAAGRLAAELPGRVLVGATTPVADPGDLAAAVGRARQVVRAARRSGRRTGVVMERDVAAHRLVTRAIDPQVLSEFVHEQIGPLVDHDREHRSETAAHPGRLPRVLAVEGAHRRPARPAPPVALRPARPDRAAARGLPGRGRPPHRAGPGAARLADAHRARPAGRLRRLSAQYRPVCSLQPGRRVDDVVRRDADLAAVVARVRGHRRVVDTGDLDVARGHRDAHRALHAADVEPRRAVLQHRAGARGEQGDPVAVAPGRVWRRTRGGAARCRPRAGWSGRRPR
ncbi:hypothetical protein [Nocardioides convexus]|uniref:hypothetical protein n=1 Tax=Nocardioides convexus TaxID=2712224 RepID=UPI00241893E9|nr:hypothetical protein [Nocardioides convexus]